MRRLILLGLCLLVSPSLNGAADPGAEARPVPDMTLTTLDGDGKVTLESFRGRPVLLSFWASWCGPCRVELPELAELYGELSGDGFVLLTVNVDTSPHAATRFLSSLGLSIPVYRMSSKDMVTLGINGLPTNILLDLEGRAVVTYAGYSPTVPAEIRRLVAAMRGEPETTGQSSGS